MSQEDIQEGYARGYAAGQDSIAHKKENTKRVYALLSALCIIVLFIAIAYGIETTGNRENAQKSQCAAEGGVWTDSGCAWSKAVAK